MKTGISGIDKMNMETEKFDVIVRGAYTICAEEVYHSQETPGISAYAYGSPGRGEIVGGDSDADVFLVERVRDSKTMAFRKRFKEILSRFDYSKIDLPEWGTLEDLETYLNISLVEGNQVLETRFLAGDNDIDEYVKKIKGQHNNPERAIRNIVFNRFYYGQYFKQRQRDGNPNIKYCRGGSREFLLITWYSELMKMLEGSRSEGCPKIFRALQYLRDNEIISRDEFKEAINSLNFLTILRGDILELNKHTEEKGLTILDPGIGERLSTKGYMAFEMSVNNLEDIRIASVILLIGYMKMLLEKRQSLRAKNGKMISSWPMKISKKMTGFL